MANRKTKNTPSGQPGQGSQNSSPLNKRVATNIAKRKLSETSHLANDSPSKRTRSQISSKAIESPTRADSNIQPPSSAASAKNGKNTDVGKKGQNRNATSTASKRERLSRGSPGCSPLSVKKEGLKSGFTREEKQRSEFKDKVEPEPKPKPEPVRDWNDCSDVSEIGSGCTCDPCRGFLDTTDESDAGNDNTTTDDDGTDDDDGDTVKVKSPSPSDGILRRLPRYQNQNQNRQLPLARAWNGLRRQATARIAPSATIMRPTDGVAHGVSADNTKMIDLRILELQAEIETAQMKSEYEAKRAEVLKGYLDNLRNYRILDWD